MGMDLLIWLLVFVVLWLGVLNWNLASKLHSSEQQNNLQHNLILSMAKELSDLNSPNVSVAEVIPAYNIKYGQEK